MGAGQLGKFSSAWLHQPARSLRRPAAYDPNGNGQSSAAADAFAPGILKYLAVAIVILAPSAISYLRLTPASLERKRCLACTVLMLDLERRGSRAALVKRRVDLLKAPPFVEICLAQKRGELAAIKDLTQEQVFDASANAY
jgi:hypothetical protein